MRIPILLLTLLTALAACRHDAARSSYADNAILSIGSGGGYTGEYIGYTLKREDGGVYGWRERGGKQVSEDLLFHADRDSVTMIFAALAGTGFDTLQLAAPGNLTYFIRLNNADTTHTIRWGDLRTPAPDTITGFYGMMVEFIRTHR